MSRYAYPDCRPFLTKKQFLLEKKHLGPAFNKGNYFLITPDKLNEGGAVGLVASLPGILKIIVGAYDSLRSSVDKVSEEANKVFLEKAPVRTLKSMFDEDSHEDHPGSEFFRNFLKNDSDFNFTFILRYCAANVGLLASCVEEWVKSLTVAGKNKDAHHHHGDEKTVKKDSVSIYFKMLSAIGHALHTIYTAVTEGIIRALTLNTLPDKAVDFLANVLFIVILLALLIPSFKVAIFAGLGKLAGIFTGKAIAATVAKTATTKAATAAPGMISACISKCTSAVKVMEIIAETAEIGAIIVGIIPKIKKVIEAGVFKTLFEYIFGVKELPESLLPRSATTSGVNKLKDFGKSKEKQPRAPYVGEYMSDYVKDSYLRAYIGEMLFEMKIKKII